MEFRSGISGSEPKPYQSITPSEKSGLSEAIAFLEEKVKTLPHPERLQEFKLLAHSHLNKPPIIKTSVKQFAFMHTSSYLKDTPMEGGQLSETLEYWKGLLEFWKGGQKEIADPKMKTTQIEAMLSEIEDCIEFNALQEKVLQKKAFPEFLLDLIEKKLEMKGHCFFPTGWYGNPGHFMVCKFSLVNNQVVAELMTKGGGAEFHSIIAQSDHRSKRDYRFDPIVFEKESFFKQPLGLSLISRIMQLQKAQPLGTRDFDSNDLYGLFLLGGQRKERSPQDAPAVGVTTQRSGTCTETGIHVLMYESNPQEILRRMFAVKFQSLVDGYRQFKVDLLTSPDIQFYLLTAAKEHLVRIAKLHPEVISAEEFMLGYCMANEILEQCEEAKKSWIEKKRIETPEIQSTTTNPPPGEKSSKPDAIEGRKQLQGRVKLDQATREKIPPLTITKPEEVVPVLEEMCKRLSVEKLKGNQRVDVFFEIYQLLSSLPLTTGDRIDPYWDKLSSKDASRCIALLRDLITLSHRSAFLAKGWFSETHIIECKYEKERLFELNARAYDIGCQLAQRLPQLKLKGYGFQLYSLPDYCAHSPSASALLTIYNNFKKRNERAKYGILFPTTIKDIENRSGTPQLVYLKQFLDRSQHSFKDKKILRVHDRNIFPNEFMDLQILAFFCYPRMNTPLEKLSIYDIKFDDLKSLDGLASYKSRYSDDDNLYLVDTENYYEHESDRVDDPILAEHPYMKELLRLLHLQMRGLRPTILNPYELEIEQESARRNGYSWSPMKWEEDENQMLTTSLESRMGRKDHRFKARLAEEIGKKEDTALPLPKHVMEELFLLVAQTKLQVTEALNWAVVNVHLLNHPIIQIYLESVLFSTGLLKETLDESYQPNLQRIYRFLNQAFHHYSGQASQLKTLLWLTRMGVYLEEAIITHPEYKGTKKTFPDYYSVLENMESKITSYTERSYLNQHMLMTFENVDPLQLTPQDCVRLLIRRFKLEMIGFIVDPQTTALTFDAKYAYFKQYPKLKEFIANCKPEVRDQIFNTVLSSLIGKAVKLDSPWIFKENSWKNGVYTINLESSSVFLNGQCLEDIGAYITQSDVYKEIFGTGPFSCIIKDGFYYRLPDEDYRIIVSESRNIKFQKKMTLNGREGWYEYVSKEKTPKPLQLSEYQHWVSVDTAERVIFDKNAQEFRYSISGDNVIHLLDPKTGSPTPLELMNIYDYIHERTKRTAGFIPLTREEEAWALAFEQQEADHEGLEGELETHLVWRRFISNFEDPNDVLIHQERHGDTLKVDKILFSRLNGLSFSLKKIGDQEVLQCDQAPDYKLSKNQDLDLLYRMEGPIVLVSLDGKSKKVILPTHEVSYTGKRPTAIAKLNHSPLKISGKGYFVYEITTDGKSLIPENPRAALYLSLIYRSLNDFENAYKYLQKSYTYQNDEVDDLEMVTKLLQTNRFPEAAAFDCHLSIRMREHSAKHTKSSFLPKSAKEEDRLIQYQQELKKHFSSQYQAYRDRFSDYKEGIGAVPDSLRLSPHQEQLFQHHSGQRMNVELTVHDRRPLNSEDLQSMTWGKVRSMPATNFVRIQNPQEYVFDHFFLLFERARSLKGNDLRIFKMDLFFLTRSYPQGTNRSAVGPSFLGDAFMERVLSILMDVMNDPRAYSDIIIRIDPRMRSPEDKVILKQINERYSERHLVPPPPPFFPPLSEDKKPIKESPKKDILSSAKSQRQHSFSLGTSPEVAKVMAFPLGASAGLYIEKKPEFPVASGPFPLQDRNLSKEKPLVKRQIADLAAGHQLNTQVMMPHYTVHSDQIGVLEHQLSQQVVQDEQKVQTLIHEIETLANMTMGERAKGLSGEQLRIHLHELTKKKSGQVKKIQLDDLIALLLKRDPQGVLSLNSALDAKDANVIFDSLLEVFIIACKAKQENEALDIIHKLKTPSAEAEKVALTQQLSFCLDRKRNYDPNMHPEFAVYEFATGMLLRKDQVELLEWVFKNIENPNIKNVLFQFAAGGGKTKVLLPILAFFIASKGFLPCGLNISALYEIGIGDLDKSLLRAFNQNIEVLEIDLDTEVSTSQLSQIETDIKKWHQKQKCLGIKTETWHALHLKYQLALDLKDEAQIDLYYKIIEFLKKVGISLIDEARQSLDPLHESNIACGKPTTLSVREQRLVHIMTQMLAGQRADIMVKLDDTRVFPIQEVVHLLENKQAMLTDADLAAIQKDIIPYIVIDPIFHELRFNPRVQDLPVNINSLLQTYLETPNAPKPQWLVDLHESGTLSEKEIASMIDLAKKFLYETASHTLRLIQSINYGDAVKEEDLTVAPRHNKQPVTSKFQDIYVTLALTVQNVIQEGLDERKIIYILELLLKEHVGQKKAQAGVLQNTKAQELFNLWWGNGEPEAPLLEHIYTDQTSQMIQIAKRMGRHPEVIQQYLLRCALPQIKVYHEKMTSTPPDLLEGFFKNICFSATPGLIELYPVSLQNPSNPIKGDGTRFDLGFESVVMDMLCQPHNSGIVALRLETLPQFFVDLEAKAPGIMQSLCTIIDQGGIFRAFENRAVVDALVIFAKSRGILFTGGIYRKEPRGILKTETGQLAIKEEGKPDVELRGSDLREALKLLGKNFDHVLLATFFDKAITTGADILQPTQAGGLLTVGEGSTKTNVLQAAMRFRKLLLGKNGQHVLWVIEKELEAQIPREQIDRMTPGDLFLWMIRNEAFILEKAVVMRGFQGVQHLVRKLAWRQINAAGLKPAERATLFHKYRNGLVDKLITDPYETYGKKMQAEDADVVFGQYAKTCAQLLGLDDNFFNLMPKEDQICYKQLLSETKELVGKINIEASKMSQEMHQKQEVRQEVRALQETDTHHQELTLRKEIYGESESLANPDFLTLHFIEDKFDVIKSLFQKPTYLEKYNTYQPLSELFGLSIIPSDIYTCTSFMGHRSKEAQVLRPIAYVLAIQDKGQKPKYLVCSRKGAVFYKEQLFSGKVAKGRCAMLVDINGQIVQNGKDNFGFSKEDGKKLLRSDEVKDRLTILSFMNGQVRDIERLKRLAKEDWAQEEFDAALKMMRSIHIGETPIDEGSIEKVRKFRKTKKAVVIGISEELISDSIIRRLIRYLFQSRQLPRSVKPIEPGSVKVGDASWLSLNWLWPKK